MMKKNIGNIDRAIRIILFVFFVYLGYSFHWLFYVLGAWEMFTIITRRCPM
ncbi:DUF2892 domain-containing protein, partial [Candidatus Woesearchaeota archaeon]|nr:DUF2892 domain-containing protein [Candidatus Woesearchaeota archaeon]